VGQQTGQTTYRAIGRSIVFAVAVAVVLGFATAATGAGHAKPAKWIPGSLISVQQISAPKGAKAWRIMYRSNTGAGKHVLVSGLIVAPTRKPPRGGRNVLAWAHGTTGLARQCGPSGVSNPARNLVNYFSYPSQDGFDVGVPALTRFLAAGYVVAATDYQGLGTAGPHQYVVGGTLARNVLDSVKAAGNIKDAHASVRAVVLGWSEGGGASLWNGQNAGYGRPVKLLGTAALAPASDLYNQFRRAVAPGPTNAVAPSHEAALSIAALVGLQVANPKLRLQQVLLPAGVTTSKGLRSQCIEHFADTILQTSVDNGWGLDPTSHLFQPRIPPQPWLTVLKQNTPGYGKASAPILVMQGAADTVINPNATAQYIARACAFHERVQYTTYPNQTHQTIPSAAQSQYLRWIADRFAGRRAPSNCPNG
jgi:alpha-beta hydrolase superfamily lysophospholipase